MPRNNGVSWIKKSEPKFIREFKERIAYKEQASLETKKKKVVGDRPDLVTEEKEEDRPQIVQIKSGDLGEQEYNQLREKEAVETSFNSFGKILFKKPTKKGDNSNEATTSGIQEQKTEKISAELDSIFKLDQPEPNQEAGEDVGETDSKPVVVEKKKVFLEDEEKTVKEGLQPEAKRARLVDRLTANKPTTSLSASKVLAREAKSGNRKLLSFYDEEEAENEEYYQESFNEKIAKKELEEDDE